MSLVQIAPLAIGTDESNILAFHPVFTLTTSSNIVQDFMPTISVEEPTVIDVKFNIYVTEQFADVLTHMGVDVFDNADEFESEEEEEPEEDEKPKRGRGKKIEPEPEVEAPNLTYWIEYDPGISIKFNTVMALTETAQWKKKFNKNEELLSSKLAMYLAELNAYHASDIPMTMPQQTEDGMTGMNEQSRQVQEALQMAQRAKQDQHREGINRVLSWFERKILGMEETEDGEYTNAVTDDVTLSDITEMLDGADGMDDFIARLSEESEALIKYIR